MDVLKIIQIQRQTMKQKELPNVMDELFPKEAPHKLVILTNKEYLELLEKRNIFFYKPISDVFDVKYKSYA